MKRIVAIIRINQMNQTRQALVAAGLSSFTVRKVLGRGKGQVDYRVLSGAGEGQTEAIAHLKDDGPMLVPKRMMTLVANDEEAPKIIETLIAVNQTGRAGDGKIFVQTISDAVRIRTGERGSDALAQS